MTKTDCQKTDFLSADIFLESSFIEISSKNVTNLKFETIEKSWITAISLEPKKVSRKNLRLEWRGNYAKYLECISESPQKESVDYLFFVKIIHELGEDLDIKAPFIFRDELSVHKKSLINFLRHAPDLSEYLSSESILIDGDTNCISVQIKRNHTALNMFFKNDGGIVFNTFDDDQDDNSFRIFGDLLTSSKSYLKSAKIKRLLSILGE